VFLQAFLFNALVSRRGSEEAKKIATTLQLPFHIIIIIINSFES
jgi:hypothetical protein